MEYTLCETICSTLCQIQDEVGEIESVTVLLQVHEVHFTWINHPASVANGGSSCCIWLILLTTCDHIWVGPCIIPGKEVPPNWWWTLWTSLWRRIRWLMRTQHYPWLDRGGWLMSILSLSKDDYKTIKHDVHEQMCVPCGKFYKVLCV